MTNLEEHYKRVRELIPTPALYEQLAEECTELGKAALKMARIIRGENYTPITLPEAFNNVLEEYTDVYICTQTLGIEPDPEILSQKVYRWIDRNSNNSKGDSDNV